MVLRRAFGLAILMTVLGSTQALADITGFIGTNTTPENRRATGFAVGGGLLIVGFEFEYAVSPESTTDNAPALNTGMGNVLLQTPFMIVGFQPYFTTGGGVYHESLGLHSQTGFGLNTGGGVKIALAGPVRLRVDYRILNLGDEALESPAHRFYVGLNLKF
jgi:opacity protein-like surface antigen